MKKLLSVITYLAFWISVGYAGFWLVSWLAGCYSASDPLPPEDAAFWASQEAKKPCGTVDAGPPEDAGPEALPDQRSVTQCMPVPWCDASAQCSEPGAMCAPFEDGGACQVPGVPYCWGVHFSG